MSNFPGAWTYHKPYSRNDLRYEPDIMIYDPRSRIRVMVSLEELKSNFQQYHDFKVYEGVTGNKLVSEWIKDK